MEMKWMLLFALLLTGAGGVWLTVRGMRESMPFELITGCCFLVTATSLFISVGYMRMITRFVFSLVT